MIESARHHGGERTGSASRTFTTAGSAGASYPTGVKVLLTGGAGYIGSTTATALEAAGHTPVVLDSLVTGAREFVAGRAFYRGDIADRALVRRVLDEHPDIRCTVHMAARVDVPESVDRPALYYRENLGKSIELLDELARNGMHRLVFSSSASVYAASGAEEVHEGSTIGPASPYARTKAMVEQVLADLSAAGGLQALVLRYFNPIGSDPGLRSGVHVREPSHVLGQMVAVAHGRQPAFRLTGVRLPTRDGTGIRDYVHVWDVARAHVNAVERFDEVVAEECRPWVPLNLGTGRGVTVRELLQIVEDVLGRSVPTIEAPARPGDPVGAYANVDKARRLLGWSAELSVEDGVRSALAWADRREQVLGYP